MIVYDKNYRPKLKDARMLEKTVPFSKCISKFKLPKNPTFYQQMVLEWFMKWN